MFCHAINLQITVYGSWCVCEGFKVAVISRDAGRLDKLRSFVSPNTKDRLITVVGDVGESGDTS